MSPSRHSHAFFRNRRVNAAVIDRLPEIEHHLADRSRSLGLTEGALQRPAVDQVVIVSKKVRHNKMSFGCNAPIIGAEQRKCLSQIRTEKFRPKAGGNPYR